MAIDKRGLKFVRGLARGGTAHLSPDGRVALDGANGAAITIDRESLRALESQGVVSRRGDVVRARPEARGFLRREMAAESASLSTTVADAPPAPSRRTGPLDRALSPHHKAAAERFSRIFEQAAMRQRVTMRYSADQTAGSPQRYGLHDLRDSALAARETLGQALDSLPADCAGVVLDVCGFGKGLQMVETERRWPRRSAKMVLRIALDQLARHFGIEAEATGGPGVRPLGWRDQTARPTAFY